MGAKWEKIVYVAVNLLISSFNFIRSFIFLNYLNFFELGQITILQTLIQLINTLQLGFLNGGYRIFSLRKEINEKRVNETIFTYIFIVSVVVGVFLTISYFIGSIQEGSVVIFGVVTGVLSICSNWLTNVYIATQKINSLNRINFVSNIIAFSSLLFLNKIGIYAAILSFFIQPIALVVLIFIETKELIPKRFYFTLNTAKWILSFGFIPYLSGIFSYANIQIERWSVNYLLGTEEVGKFYLAIAYAAIYALVPTSLNNLFFPKAMQYFSNKEFSQFSKYIQSYFLILLAYSIITILLTLFLSEHLIIYFFPKHLENLKYVFLTLPGLAAIHLIAPIGLVFNASLRLKPILWAYASSSLFLMIGISFMAYVKLYNLSNFALLNSSVNIYISIFFVLSFLLLYKSLKTNISA